MSDLLDSATAAPDDDRPVRTREVRALLRARYPGPEWAMLEEVAPATGSGGTRYADAVAINLWSSRGHAIHGFEIKVSRADWLRELKNPSKAEPVYRFCDHWWIVAGKDIVKPGELPPTWGHLVARPASLLVATTAPKLDPAPLTRGFFAALLRRGHEQIESLAGERAFEATRAARAEVDKRVAEEVRQRGRALEELQERVRKFEEVTGLSFDRYSGPPHAVIKLATKLQVLRGYGDTDVSALVRLVNDLTSITEKLRGAIAATGLEDKA